MFLGIPVGIISYLIDRFLLNSTVPNYAKGDVFMAAMLPIVCVGSSLAPLVFKNFSIGMRSLGLAIVNEEGYRPPLRIVLMRQLFFYNQSKKILWKLNRLFMTMPELNDGFEYFGTKIVYIGDDDSVCEEACRYKRENDNDSSHIQYLKPISKETDYAFYTVPVLKTVIASLIYVCSAVLCLVVFPLLNVYEIPVLRDCILIVSALSAYFDIFFLMSSIGYIFYVSEKKKCQRECNEIVDQVISE